MHRGLGKHWGGFQTQKEELKQILEGLKQIMFKLGIEACLDVSPADKGKNDIPCKSMQVLEYVTSWELPSVGLFVDMIGEEAGGTGRSQIMKGGVECHTESLNRYDKYDDKQT